MSTARSSGHCHSCSHPEVEAIDALLRSGATYASVAKRYGMTAVSVGRHFRNGHVLGEVDAKIRAGSPADLDELVASLSARVREGGNPAHARELRLALIAQAEWRASLPGSAPDLAISEEWIELRVALREALAPYPGATAAVNAAIQRLLGAADA
jgi:transposase-like protein